MENKHTTTNQMNSEKLLSQNLQSSQIISSSATIATSYNSDGSVSGDNRNTTITISNSTVTLSPNQSISSAMNATTMPNTATAAASCSSNGGENKNSNACQPRPHPKKRKFNIADLEEIDSSLTKSHNNCNNNNTINTNKNNGSQNGTDPSFGGGGIRGGVGCSGGSVGLSAAITNQTVLHSDITDKRNNNVHWPISNDNGMRTNNAIIVNVGSIPQTISLANEHTLVVSTNSHSGVSTAILNEAKSGSHSEFSQNCRNTDNGSTKNDNSSLMTVRNEYPVIASHEHSTSINSSNATHTIHHCSPRSNEPLKYGVQSSIIRMAGTPEYKVATVTTASAPPHTTATTITATTIANEQSQLDLSEWCNHRVLARQEDIYVAGIIRSVDTSNTILVEFDYPEGTQQSYYDVLGSGRFDIISDASPSVGDITIGTRVVCSCQGHTSFIGGEIMQILNDTKQFVVRTYASAEVKTVKRAQIRLLQPPWWDELNDTNTVGDNASAAKVITGQIKSLHAMEPNMYQNTMAGAVAAAASSNTLNPNGIINASNRTVKYMTPLQVHHLLPTVQVFRFFYSHKSELSA